MRVQINTIATEIEHDYQKIFRDTFGISRDEYSKYYRSDERSFAIMYICPNCYHELFGYWKFVEFYNSWDSADSKINNYINKYRNKVQTPMIKEIIKLAQTDSCPICGAKLSKKWPYAVQQGELSNYWKSIDNKNVLCESKHYEEPLIIKDIYDLYEIIGECVRLPKKFGDAIDQYSSEIYFDNIFNYLSYLIIDKQKNNSENSRDDYLELCEEAPFEKINIPRSITADYLKKHIEHLINIETDILALSKRLEKLYFQRELNLITINNNRYITIIDLLNECIEKESALSIDELQLKQIQDEPIKLRKVSFPTRPSQPALKTYNIFNKKRILQENEIIMSTYNFQLAQYEREVEKCKREEEQNRIKAEQEKEAKIIECQNKCQRSSEKLEEVKKQLKSARLTARKGIDKVIAPEIGEKMLLDDEIQKAEATLKALITCRKQLYSMDIVFDKYRNIVALSSFYEYLMSGRCETLEGSDGAYNIYESEIRLNRIIDQLDEVIVSLDEIKKNQYMIFNALKSIDSSLSSLNRSMDKAVKSIQTIEKNTENQSKYLEQISANTAVIAHNTKVSAYYSKINAELTDALGFMVALG